MRLFIATTFPAAATAPINDRAERVKPRLPSASWVRPESQHLTFAFLGEQRETIVDTLTPLLQTRLAPIASFDAELRGCGFFPNARHARVGWVGAEPREQFVALAAAVREAVSSAGVTLDGGEFRPHLTLMRIRDRWPPMSIETFERTFRDFTSPPFRVTAVTLYSSKLGAAGAVHTALREVSLSP
jgi:RNA 2',3'-cyclic 3'-phosphodiesterase